MHDSALRPQISPTHYAKEHNLSDPLAQMELDRTSVDGTEGGSVNPQRLKKTSVFSMARTAEILDHRFELQ